MPFALILFSVLLLESRAACHLLDSQVNLDTYGNVDKGWMKHHMYLPHEVLGHMWDFDRELFHKIFGSPEASQPVMHRAAEHVH